jgi:L-lactate permease
MEGDLLRKTILPTVIYALLAGLAGLALAYGLTGLY